MLSHADLINSNNDRALETIECSGCSDEIVRKHTKPVYGPDYRLCPDCYSDYKDHVNGKQLQLIPLVSTQTVREIEASQGRYDFSNFR